MCRHMDFVLLSTMFGKTVRLGFEECRLHNAQDMVVSRSTGNQLSVKYRHSGKEAMDTSQNVGYAGDGAQVRGFKLWNAVLLAPGGLCVIACPQVVPFFLLLRQCPRPPTSFLLTSLNPDVPLSTLLTLIPISASQLS